MYWSASELDAHIIESIRVLQALTGCYRQRVSLTATAGECLYDLHSLPAFSFSVSADQALGQIKHSLLEPDSWTDQFSKAQVLAALTRRRDQFLLDTGIRISRLSLGQISPPPDGRVQLPDSVIDVRRAYWTSTGGLRRSLWREDEHAAASFSSGWQQNPSTPEAFSVALTPPASLQLVPPPVDEGELELVVVQSGQTLGEGVMLGVPDDFAWAVKWGAIADLLASDGPSRDPRSSYCESLYKLGVEAARINPSVLQVHVNQQEVFLASIHDLDSFLPSWRNAAQRPAVAAMAGRNLLCLPKPDANYGLALDAVTNIPVPAVDSDFLQVGREMLEPVLDLAQHFASFKMAGYEFYKTELLFRNFLRQVSVVNSRMSVASVFRRFLEGHAHNVEQSPRIKEDVSA